MLGAIIGDIAGSRFEWHNIKTKDFELLTKACHYTDDTAMSLAVCDALMSSQKDWSSLAGQTVTAMQKIGRLYPGAGYGGRFRGWLSADDPHPYNSWGNGSAMRVSGCGWAASSLEEAEQLAGITAGVTHNHPEGIKGAQAVAAAVYMARTGSSIREIRDYINEHYYPMNFTLDSIRAEYAFDVSCQGSVPQAIEAFVESISFEDAIRNAISIGGDSDTIGAITGSIAEAYYGIPEKIRRRALTFLDARLLKILNDFEAKYGIAAKTKRRTTVPQILLSLAGLYLLVRGFLESKLLDGLIMENAPMILLYSVGAVLLLAGILLPLICKGFRKFLAVRIVCLLLSAFLLFIFATAGIIAAAPLFMPKADESEHMMLVLGAPVVQDQPSMILQSRADKAAEWANAHPDLYVMISGGKGGTKTEAETIADLMVEKGIDPDCLMIEDRATTTEENFIYAKELFGQQFDVTSEPLVVLTNHFHLFRLHYFAERQGFGCIRYVTAPTPSPVRLLWYTREVVLTVRYWFTGIS